MKPILHIAVYAAMSALLAGCAQSGPGKTSSARSSDSRTAMTSDERRAVDQRPGSSGAMRQRTDDAAVASGAAASGAATTESSRDTAFRRTDDPAYRTTDDRRATDGHHACTLVWKNPAIRTETAFSAVQVRVYDDIASPLYRSSRTKTADDRYRDEQYRASDERFRTSDERFQATDERFRTPEDRARTSDVERRTLDNEPRRIDEARAGDRNPTQQGLDQVGRTGGTMQDSGSAQQGGTLQQGGREPMDRNDQSSLRTQDDRARMGRDEARFSNRDDARLSNRGNLIWSGWLKPGEKLDISSASGPIRYDYRFVADDHFHGNKGAWCNEGHHIAIP